MAAVPPEGDGARIIVERAHVGPEHLHERALEDVYVLKAESGDLLIRLAAQVEHHVLAGRRLEQVERVV
ncbi:MAG: hypothetical protein WKF84_11655 [Pyrinomonadaceae bacterium]